jgi:fatty acid desaturase
MSSVAVSPVKQKTLNDPELKETLQRLRRTDDRANFYYLLRTYVYLALVIGGTIAFFYLRGSWGLPWWLNAPVTILAIILVGAGQHQLSGLAHEAVHHTLFRNRYLNDLASEWFCMYPLFSSTHHYRLQHLAHHQFVNDPVRDPDISQLQTSGHWLPFPLTRKQFLVAVLKQLWLPNLFRFMRIRAAYNATGTDKNPYLRKDWKPSKVAIRIAILYLLLQVATLAALVIYGDPLWLAVVSPALYVAVVVCYLLLPASKFHQSRIHSEFSQRVATMMRVTFITLVFNAIAWLALLVDPWTPLYYVLLWLVPIFTSFSFFMILRQWVQHGNADRGWLTNTRSFFVARFINFSVFPIGQDYHLPHHLYATVPHYRLKELHEALLAYPEYQEQAVQVHGYFVSPEKPQVHPTVLDVLGPEYAPRGFRGVHIDDTVLEDVDVEEKAEILREGAAEVERLSNEAKRKNQD